MVTANYYRWQYAMEARTFDGEAVNVGVIDIDGNLLDQMYVGVLNVSGNWATYLYDTKTIKNVEMRIGTGVNTYAKDTYCLANDITSNITNLQKTQGFNVEDGVYKRLFTVSGVNNTSSPITITEIGITKKLYNNYNVKYALFGIVTLNQPITVAAGDGFSVSITWTSE